MDLRFLLFSFHGRINRAKFWLASVIYLAMLAALAGVITIGDFNQDSFSELVDSGLLYAIIAVGLFIVLIWSSTATSIKRLHDRGKSGWWIVVFSVVPVTIGLIADITGGTLSFTLNLVSAALSVWAFVELACLRGTEGPNDYGPDPLRQRIAAMQA